MQVDVAAHIKALLYRHDRVIIPNLGGFNTIYQPATIELHGHIVPPTKLVSFDKELTFNDNLLIERIVEVEHLSYQEAVEQVESFVQKINSTLQKGQNTTFSVEDVGRLYIDAGQKLKFLPDGENFLTEAFGLPSVEYFPVTRKTYAVEVTPVQIAKPKPTFWAYLIKTWQDRYIRYFVGISLILLVVIIPLLNYINHPGKWVDPSFVEAKDIKDQNNVVDQGETLNPFTDIDKSLISEERTQETQDEIPVKRVNQPPIKVNKSIETVDNTPLPTQPIINESTPLSNNVHIVMVGAYGSIENAQKAFKKLERKGHEPYMEDIKTKFRIGIKVKGDAKTLKEQLKKIRKTYKGAWVKK